MRKDFYLCNYIIFVFSVSFFFWLFRSSLWILQFLNILMCGENPYFKICIMCFVFIPPPPSPYVKMECSHQLDIIMGTKLCSHSFSFMWFIEHFFSKLFAPWWILLVNMQQIIMQMVYFFFFNLMDYLVLIHKRVT